VAFDPGVRPSVARHVLLAGVVLAAGCRPAVVPAPPGEEPTPPRVVKRAAPPAARQGLLGEMCPQAAAGRPGLSPLVVRRVSWSSDRAEVLTPLSRGEAAQFAVLAVDGRRAGVFAPVGTADTDGVEVAVGSYVGAPPCSTLKGKEVVADPTCLKVQRGCGLAVAPLSEPGSAFDSEGAAAPEVAVGGVCASGDRLVIDLEHDGAPEVFPLAAFVDAVRAPAEEVTAAAVAVTCTPTFALAGLTPALQGVGLDARHKLELDVLGVLDVDGDGRNEVVIAFRYPDKRTVAVYSAIESPARLELVGEMVPWP